MSGIDDTMKVTKSYLKNTVLCKYHVMSVTNQTYKTVIIKVNHFFKYIPDIIRVRKSQFTIFAKGERLEITITETERYKTIDCFIAYNYMGDISEMVSATTMSKTTYKIVLPFEMFKIGEKIRINDDLHVVIRFISGRASPPEMYSLLRSRALYINCTELSHYFLRLARPVCFEAENISFRMEEAWARRLQTDFVVLVQGRAIHAHRALLACRSTYFRDHIRKICGEKEDGAMRIGGTTYEAATTVICFLYTGRLDVRSLDKMIAVFELAKRLKLKALLDHCGNHLLKHVKEGDRLLDAESRGPAIEKFIADYCKINRQNGRKHTPVISMKPHGAMRIPK